MKRRASCKKFNLKRGLISLMRSNGKRDMWVGEFYLIYSTATSRVKRKLRKVIIIRERNTQNKEATKSSRKELGSHENLGKPKSLTRGLQATHELGGLNVEV